MKNIEAFLKGRDKFDEYPAETVRLAASALLELSLLKPEKPVRIKRGMPVFKHLVPTERFIYGVKVRPHLNSALALPELNERVVAADSPASMTLLNGMYTGVTFSFDVSRRVVAVDLNKGLIDPCGESSVTERGANTIRNAWQAMHLPTVAYVEQAASMLPRAS